MYTPGPALSWDSAAQLLTTFRKVVSETVKAQQHHMAQQAQQVLGAQQLCSNGPELVHVLNHVMQQAQQVLEDSRALQQRP